MTPRTYLSWSQYDLFRKSPKEYKKRYFDGKTFSNKYTAFGKEFAEKRETNDVEHGHFAMGLPVYPRREYEITVEIKVDGKKVMLLGRIDGCDLRKHIVADDKTGKLWTQARADKAEQLTFYALLYWLKKKKIPKLFIHWIETRVVDGEVVTTGRVETFETTRTMKDLLVLLSKINKVWRGILEMSEREWKSVL